MIDSYALAVWLTITVAYWSAVARGEFRLVGAGGAASRFMHAAIATGTPLLLIAAWRFWAAR